ncbi:DUF938 domain-containing protein [Marinihelvus fidelis]|uniref:DUF938 domain-containing protein n=1 Tax=Marinihelvus fidelis TaxID=2613842 RepID=A0A5N0T897_9GAMM|nr:DUF938 domain-containing protein [Marinihelvus fidelis]KAA9131263.1 DUF938 domain-containing protein [Marinihelvus fidelis]
MSHADLPFAPASERNRVPILDAVGPRLGAPARLLEIGAGTGQHAVYMAAALPHIDWWPTDRSDALPGLQARLDFEAPANVHAAQALDVLADPWPEGPFDIVYSANTAHIMPWAGVEAMAAGIDNVLASDGRFFLYGPFNIDGAYTSDGNRDFDRDLRRRDPNMGIRDVEALETLLGGYQMALTERLPMPANNQLLVFSRLRNSS